MGSGSATRARYSNLLSSLRRISASSLFPFDSSKTPGSAASHTLSRHGNTASASLGNESMKFMSPLHLPETRGTVATATSSARSPSAPPRHGEFFFKSKRCVTSSTSSSTSYEYASSPRARVEPNGFPKASLLAPRAAPVVSGERTVIGGSLMNPSPKMEPRNSASKSSAHAPVFGSSQPCRDRGTMSMRTPGGRGTPNTRVVRPHTGGPSNVLTSKRRRSASGCFGSGGSTTPSVVAPDAS
mmetsp:Transcript_9511/g.40361  ORF Transcript_9511/g.40361 Transcript_9511/m.40361 type:complete len:242 (+) Transcript_9511:233-958(+)